MPRGGKRQGTPGKAYSNRTDMTSNYANAGASAASGGQTPPSAPIPQQVRQPDPNQMFPEDTPMLLDPTNRPGEPVTSGLPTGAGPGPEQMDTRVAETQALKTFLPLIEPILDDVDTPQSVRMLVKYIRNI